MCKKCHHSITTQQVLQAPTVVWKKFTVGHFHVKIVCGKIFSSLGVYNEKILTNYIKVKLTYVPLLMNLIHNYIYPCSDLTCILHKYVQTHNDNRK